MAETPVQIFDISGPKPVEGTIAPSEVQAAVASGKFSLPKGEVPVYSPDGVKGTLDASEAPSAFQQGFKYASPDVEKQAGLDTPKAQAQAFLHGVAQSGTAGLVDLIPNKSIYKTSGEAMQDTRDLIAAHPGLHTAGEIAGIMIPGGVGTGIAKTAEAAAGEAGAGILGKAANYAERGAIENAIFQGNNETAKWIQSDPTQSAETAAMNVGLAGLIGGAAGGGGGAALGATNKVFDALKGSELTEGLAAFRDRMRGHLGMEPAVPEVTDPRNINYRDIFNQKNEALNLAPEAPAELTKAQKMGHEFADWVYNKGLSEAGGVAIGEAILPHLGVPHGVAGWLGEKFITPVIEKVMPTMMRPLLNSQVDGSAFQGALNLGRGIVRGENKLNKAVANVFGNADNPIEQPDIEGLKKKVNVLSAHPELLLQNDKKSAMLMPDHDAATSMATVRSVQYLASLKPKTDAMGPLDPPVKPNAIQEARYNNALKIAQEPGLVLNKIKAGTLTISDVQDLNAMYPALGQRMQTKLSQEMIRHHGSGGAIPYKTKMSIAMLTNAPLVPSMSGQSIISAQSVMHTQAQQPGPMQQKHRNMDKLGKFAQNEMTGAQAAEARHTSQKA